MLPNYVSAVCTRASCRLGCVRGALFEHVAEINHGHGYRDYAEATGELREFH